MRGMLPSHLGASLAADTAASGVNYDWMQEFTIRRPVSARRSGPPILGFGAVLDNLSAFLDNTPRPIVIVGAAGAYILALAVSRRRDHRPVRARSRHRRPRVFLGVGRVLLSVSAAGGGDGARLRAALRLAARRGCSTAPIPRLTREITVERTAFLIRAGALPGVRLRARRLQSRVRLRQGARGRRRSAQHARGASAGAALHPRATSPPPRLSTCSTSRCSRSCSRRTRPSPRAPAASAGRCGSASRSGRATSWRGCG